jgi:hypothetical protein
MPRPPSGSLFQFRGSLVAVRQPLFQGFTAASAADDVVHLVELPLAEKHSSAILSAARTAILSGSFDFDFTAISASSGPRTTSVG